MMKEMMHGNFDDSESVLFKPYSMDHGMKNNMMKMMKNVFGNEYSNNHYDMMEKFFKNDNDMDAFEMMKMNEKNFESHESYAPPQARHNRYKRQAYKPQARNTEQRLDKGDRLFAKLQEQKREHEEHVGNMACV